MVLKAEQILTHAPCIWVMKIKSSYHTAALVLPCGLAVAFHVGAEHILTNVCRQGHYALFASHSLALEWHRSHVSSLIGPPPSTSDVLLLPNFAVLWTCPLSFYCSLSFNASVLSQNVPSLFEWSSLQNLAVPTLNENENEDSKPEEFIAA